MIKALFCAVAAIGVSGALFAATTQSKSTKKRSPTKAAASHTAGRTTAKTTKARAKGKTAARPVRSYQQAPTPERYQEIQQALAAKGYFQGQANGQWGADSVDALKRFQTDQNLMPDGKINSLSLIAMGLGPKRLTAQKTPPANPANAAPAASPATPPASNRVNPTPTASPANPPASNRANPAPAASPANPAPEPTPVNPPAAPLAVQQ